jgi:hypothetical protein
MLTEKMQSARPLTTNPKKSYLKEVRKCPVGNAQIVGIPLMPMPTPTNAHPAMKSVNF